MKKTILTSLLLAGALTLCGQNDYTKSGLTLSLREDLVDVSMPMSNHLNPTHTTISHIFGTELSVGFREVLSPHWSIGLSVGLMLHDYAWTNRFANEEVSTRTHWDGSTTTRYETYSGQTTLNLPLLLDVKFRFASLADNLMWEVIPMLSTRIGYVVGLTSIYGERYEEDVWHNGDIYEGGISEDILYSAFNKQGFHFALGVGFSYHHFDLEFEYAMQPNCLIQRHVQTFHLDSEAEPRVYDMGAGRYAFAAGDGFTLRLTYNF